jgi:hypothetical protein
MSDWRSRFREDNRLLLELLRGPFGKLYGIAGAATFFYQLAYRLETCPDFLGCSLSLLKGAIWSVAWPLWWAMHATGFALIHAFLGK